MSVSFSVFSGRFFIRFAEVHSFHLSIRTILEKNFQKFCTSSSIFGSWTIFFGVLPKIFHGLSKLHSTCADEHVGENLLFWRSWIFISFSDKEWKFPGLVARRLCRDCQKCIPLVHRNHFEENKLEKKLGLSVHFRTMRWKKMARRQTFWARIVKTAIYPSNGKKCFSR